MSEEFIRKLVINGKSKSTHENYLRQMSKLELFYRKSLKAASPKKLGAAEKLERALKKMGIKPEVCSCRGAMKTIKTLPDKFRISARAPPKLIVSKELKHYNSVI